MSANQMIIFVLTFFLSGFCPLVHSNDNVTGGIQESNTLSTLVYIESTGSTNMTTNSSITVTTTTTTTTTTSTVSTITEGTINSTVTIGSTSITQRETTSTSTIENSPINVRSGPGWWLLIALLITIVIVIIAGIAFYNRQQSTNRRTNSCSHWCRYRFRNWRSHDDDTDNIILQLEQPEVFSGQWPPRISFS